MPIDSSLARESLAGLGERLGTDSEGAAEGVVRLVNNSMAKAMSIVSVERGRDPREFVMVSFGGSGPVHACDIAEELGVRDIIVPVHAGMFSAFGLLVADLTRTFVSPVLGAAGSLGSRFRELEALASEEMRKEGLKGFAFMRFVEARYEGQSHELLLPFRGAAALRKEFDRRHEEIYGYSTDDRLQIVNARVKAVIRRGGVPPIGSASGRRSKSAGRRKAWFAGKIAAAPVLNRDGLRTGDGGAGPCIIEEYDSTLVVNPGWKWRIEPFGTRMWK
jgi:N-methylhydantoinase A